MSILVTLFILVAVIIILISRLNLLIHNNRKSNVCLLGKTALVTGGSGGIGYQIVLGLLQRGCRVIIADKLKGENLLENIFKETHNRNVSFEYLDLSSFKCTREFAKKIKKSEKRLDILIHNAGIGGDVSRKTEDGLDITLQVNYYSTFLLTHLLADLVKEAKGRIIFTASVLAYFHNLSVETIKPDGISSPTYTFHYSNSKLCLILATEIFGEKLKKYGVTCNAYHPWLVPTAIYKKDLYPEGKFSRNRYFIWLLYIMAMLSGNSTEKAAQTPIYLACANEVVNETGKYFLECKPTFKPLLTSKKRVSQAIWEMSEEIVGLTPKEKL